MATALRHRCRRPCRTRDRSCQLPKSEQRRNSMTSAHSTAIAACCAECGAAVAQGREGCQTLFDEVLAREFGDYRYARMHRLTVDAYALQHPAEYMRSAKSYAAHLTGMYAAIDAGAPAEINRAVQQWLNGSNVLLRPDHPAPRQRGVLTILHVYEAVAPEEPHSPSPRVGAVRVAGVACVSSLG